MHSFNEFTLHVQSQLWVFPIYITCASTIGSISHLCDMCNNNWVHFLFRLHVQPQLRAFLIYITCATTIEVITQLHYMCINNSEHFSLTLHVHPSLGAMSSCGEVYIFTVKFAVLRQINCVDNHWEHFSFILHVCDWWFLKVWLLWKKAKLNKSQNKSMKLQKVKNVKSI